MENVNLLEYVKSVDGDWCNVFAYADPDVCPGSKCSGGAYDEEDVAEVIALEDGENDGQSWVAVFKLKDGRFALLSAWCDYTGWGCQEDGHSYVADTLEQLYRLGLDSDARDRLFPNGLPEGAS